MTFSKLSLIKSKQVRKSARIIIIINRATVEGQRLLSFVVALCCHIEAMEKANNTWGEKMLFCPLDLK
jgi:hypothetical protein